MHHHECEGPSFIEIRGVDPASLQVFHAFFKAMRLHRQLMFRMMSQKDIYPGQAGCLWVIGANDGIPQRDLARRLHVARPTITIMLPKMAAAGLITRQPDENDQRLTRIYLTDAGRRLQDEMNSTLADFISASFGRMTTDDLKDFERLLSSLCSIIDQELSSSGSVAVSDLDQQ